MVLADEKCQACRGDAPKLTSEEIQELKPQIPEWSLKEKSIERTFKFKDFREAMDFVNKVANLANAQDHHPDIHIYYSKVTLECSTHKIGGLSRNDFILASQVDGLLQPA
jgi:4a-hydroxytetrahydrobiopterin dehydratase